MATAADPAHARPIFICVEATKEAGGRGRTPELSSCQRICSVSGSLSSLSSSKAIYEPLPLSPPASPSILSDEVGLEQKGKKGFWLGVTHFKPER